MTSAGTGGGDKNMIMELARKARRITRLVLSWLLLGAVYAFIFFPARIVISIAGVDPLRTGRRRKADSYWRKISGSRRGGGYGDWYS